MESQKKKYATKILLCDVNVNKNVGLEEVEEFANLPHDQKEHIKFHAFSRRLGRMNMI